MKSFRDCSSDLHTAEMLLRLREAFRRADWLELLVEAGEFEQAVLDARHIGWDEWGPVEDLLRRFSLSCAAVFSGRSEETGTCEALLDEVTRQVLPSTVRVRAPEGYTHYALSPGAYLESAKAYVKDVGYRKASRALVIGVRTIGTSLSAVVATATNARQSFTVRPRGESGHRYIMVDDSISALLDEVRQGGGDVLVVDEGPGATGETFATINAWLLSCGIAGERIVYFCSHMGGFSMAPRERKQWFDSVRRYAPPNEQGRVEALAARYGLDVIADLSGGQWRAHIAGAQDAPVCPNHERRKYLARDAGGRRFLIRYAGLGRWGTATAARAEQLAQAQIGPRVVGYTDGFLISEWIEGRMIVADDRAALLEAVPSYVARRAGLFPLEQPVDRTPILEALVENAEEALGGSISLRNATRRIECLPDRPAVIADSRLQPFEWIVTKSGIQKVDTLDHGDGIRLPGPTDAAWDIAGFRVEYEPDDVHLEALVTACAARAGDEPAELQAAVLAYVPAYAAVALGEATLAAREAWCEEDRNRLEYDVSRYRSALHASLAAFQRVY